MIFGANEYQATINGQPLSGVDKRGYEWVIPADGVKGVFEGAKSTLTSSAHPWGDFSIFNRPTLTGLDITVTGFIVGGCYEYLLKSYNDMLAAIPVRETVPLTVSLGATGRLMFVEMQAQPLESEEGPAMLKWSISLFSRQSVKYDVSAPLSGSTRRPSYAGGLDIPYTFGSDPQYAFPESQEGGLIRFYNRGNAGTPISIMFDGALTNPRITHVQTNRRIAYTGGIGQGNRLTFDGETKRVRWNDSIDVQKGISSRQWITSVPGENTLMFDADAGDGVASAVMREGWL